MNKSDLIIIYFALNCASNCVNTSIYENTKLNIPMKTENESCFIDIESENIFSKKNFKENHFEASKNAKQDYQTQFNSKTFNKKKIKSPTNLTTFSENDCYVQHKDLENLLNENRDQSAKQCPGVKNLNKNTKKKIYHDENNKIDLENATVFYVSKENQKRATFLSILMSVFVVSLNIIFVLIAWYLEFNKKEIVLVGFIVVNFTFLELFAVLK